MATTTSSADRVSQVSDAINTTAAKDFDVVLKDDTKGGSRSTHVRD